MAFLPFARPDITEAEIEAVVGAIRLADDRPERRRF